MSQGIVPRFKLLISYDINQSTHEAYYHFVFTDLVPAMQTLGLYMMQVYHTAYGDYPVRQLVFVAEDIETIKSALESEAWNEVCTKFNEYTTNFSHKIVQFRDAFQF
jgi:hypothetical protein